MQTEVALMARSFEKRIEDAERIEDPVARAAAFNALRPEVDAFRKQVSDGRALACAEACKGFTWTTAKRAGADSTALDVRDVSGFPQGEPFKVAIGDGFRAATVLAIEGTVLRLSGPRSWEAGAEVSGPVVASLRGIAAELGVSYPLIQHAAEDGVKLFSKTRK